MNISPTTGIVRDKMQAALTQPPHRLLLVSHLDASCDATFVAADASQSPDRVLVLEPAFRRFPTRLSLSALLLVAFLCATVPASAPAAPKNNPAIYIYYADFYSVHRCCEVRDIDNLLHLDGTNEWFSTDKRWTECRMEPPMSVKVYHKILPYLSRATPGYFSGHVHVKIVNKDSGKETYIDDKGGVYTFGERFTRNMPHKDFTEVRKIMHETGCYIF
ncbi:MAG: hypothetical protein K0U66_06200 [Gammaproteobacteria bacterium]|nr:hypothetical protein [Gammaproteobacteria bacterium]